MGIDLSLQQLKCTGCGAGLHLTPASRAKMVVCKSCGSQIDLTKPDHAVFGTVDKRRRAYPASMIRLEKTAVFDGVKYMVIGRIRYMDDENYFWDEWLLLSEKGKYKWLAEDHFHFYFYELIRPKTPVDPNKCYNGRAVTIDGKSYTCYEKAQARIHFVEGELTWKAQVDEKVWYVDGAAPPEKLSIEWNDTEIQVYQGPYMAGAEIYEAFGFDVAPPRPSDVSPCQPYKRTPGQEAAIDTCILAAVLAVISLMYVGMSYGSGTQILKETYTLQQLQTKVQTKVFEIKSAPTVCRASLWATLGNGWMWVGADLVDEKDKLQLSFSEQMVEGYQYYRRKPRGEVFFRIEKPGKYRLKLEGKGDKSCLNKKVNIWLYSGIGSIGWLVFFLLCCGFYPAYMVMDYYVFLARRRTAMMDS